MKKLTKAKAAADKVAHAKELKRIRDAKYRAKKRAAKQAKPQQPKTKCNCGKSGDKCNCGDMLALAGMTMLANDLCLHAVLGHKELPESLRKMVQGALALNNNYINLLRRVTSKEVR